MKTPKLIQLLFFLLVLTQCKSNSELDKPTNFLSFDKTKIAYSDEGNGKPVLLIHGFISNASSWDNSVIKEKLLENGYRVIVPDLRGNGKSDRPQNPEAYKNDAEIKDLIGLANHLDIEDYVAIGYSRGSIVLAKLLTKEKRISKAVIGGMGFDFTNPNWDRRIAFANAFRGKSELTEMTKGAVEYAKSINADLKALGLLQEYQPVTLPSELQNIKVETLVLCGDQDTDNGDPKELQSYLPNSHLVLVKGDHNNTYKQDNFAQAVLDFMKKK